MAWSGADISTADLAFAAADKPIIAGINALRDPQSIKWATTANGADITLAANPAVRAYDGLTHLRTKPNTSGTEFWLSVQLSATVDDFDGVLVVNQSGLSGVSALLEVRISDDAGWTSNQETIASTTVSTDARVAFLDLQDSGASVAQRYSTVPYFFLRFTDASTFTPEVGEVWLLRRRQMEHFPRLPFDPNMYNADYIARQSKSGAISTYVNHDARQDLSARFSADSDAEKTEFNSFIADCGYGSKPFIWVEKPNSEPEKFRIIQRMPGGIPYPLVGPFERQITIEGQELGPQFQALE